MSNQLTTLENYQLADLCTTGGLQVIYEQAFTLSTTEITDLTTVAGRKRIKSLAAQVSSSKVLFEKACRGYVAEQKVAITEAEKEIRTFVKSMDQLRDSTKQPALDSEAYLIAELEAYAESIQRQEDAEKAAQNALYEAQALLFSHLEAIIQNMEFDALKLPEDIAKTHCENKGQVFDFELFDAEKIVNDAKYIPEDHITSIVGHIIDKSVVDTIDYQRLAAEEAFIEHSGILPSQACDILDAIIDGQIPGVTYE